MTLLLIARLGAAVATVDDFWTADGYPGSIAPPMKGRPMRPLATLTALCFAAALLADCSAFHSSFRSSFKTSFMKSCTAQAGATEKLCGCVESTLERKNTDDQLIKMAGDGDNKQVTDAARACAAQH
jgi:hypothetical protein